MKKQIKAVETFHKVFKAPIGEKPKLIDKEMLSMQLIEAERPKIFA